MIEGTPRGEDGDAAAAPSLGSGGRPGIREERQAGERIFVVDLTGLRSDELQPVLDRAIARIRQEPPASVRLVTVVKDVRLGVGVADIARAYSAAIRPHVKAGAVVGLSAFSKAIFLMVKPFLHASTTAFPDLASAKRWLADYR